ncbi:hypothetical protein [Quatrionicoccus australiensis]|uniref:hypothetical protein n=1 Tax=Quatrionicoccus australiensis TaxID=138118 RepID=UPI001CFBE6F4|nr:hypothetical protein [Quatrionicoccus australiensis]
MFHAALASPPSNADQPAFSLPHAADANLYAAKRAGRNRIGFPKQFDRIQQVRTSSTGQVTRQAIKQQPQANRAASHKQATGKTRSGLDARLSARRSGWHVTGNTAKQTFDGFAILEYGHAAHGNGFLGREFLQTGAHVCQRDPGFCRDIGIKQLAVFFQMGENCVGVHSQNLYKDADQLSAVKIDETGRIKRRCETQKQKAPARPRLNA